MKLIKLSFILLILLISESSLFAGRGNPIMVIEFSGDCDTYEEVEVAVDRSDILTREIPNAIPCIDDNCPEGYKFRDNEVCECEPDCEEIINLFPDLWLNCMECEVPYWVTDQNANSETVGFCGCELDGGPEFCFCPPWFSEVVEGGGNGNTICDIPQDVPCFQGSLNVISQDVDCDNIDENGLVSASIIIDLGIGNEGACVSIVALLNCQLSGDEDFVIALAEQYEVSAAFCAEPDETTIQLDFLFDPDPELDQIPTWVWRDINGMDQPQPLLTGENLCGQPIPTLSTWMIITLGLVMAISGLLFVKRKEVRKAISTMMLSL